MTMTSQTDAYWLDANVTRLLELAIDEDLSAGDPTSEAIFPEDATTRAVMRTRQATVVSGVEVVVQLFQRLNRDVSIRTLKQSGDHAKSGDSIMEWTGSTRSILAGERIALNLMMRMCGVANATAALCAEIPKDCPAKLLDTRKTVPGWRTLDKAAVRHGGGCNHRLTLGEAMMIKDNHIAAAGSITEAVQRARAHAPNLELIVEVDTLEQLDTLIPLSPDIALLDNFSSEDLQAALHKIDGRFAVEVSGGIGPGTLQRFSGLALDRISVGYVTHSAIPTDLTLEID